GIKDVANPSPPSPGGAAVRGSGRSPLRGSGENRSRVRADLLVFQGLAPMANAMCNFFRRPVFPGFPDGRSATSSQAIRWKLRTYVEKLHIALAIDGRPSGALWKAARDHGAFFRPGGAMVNSQGCQPLG